jgi:hypothetical protein
VVAYYSMHIVTLIVPRASIDQRRSEMLSARVS